MNTRLVTRGIATLAATLLLGNALAAPPQPPAAPGGCQMSPREHAPEKGGAMSLEPLLPQLQLNAKQDALWQQAETARVTRQIAQRRATQQAHATLQVNLANGKLPLSLALRDALPVQADSLFAGVEWAAFLDSLNPQQAQLVRQFLLAHSGSGMMPAKPELPPEGAPPRS